MYISVVVLSWARARVLSILLSFLCGCCLTLLNCNLVKFFFFIKMPSRQEKKRAKRQAKYLKTRDDILHSARASYKAELEKKRASQRENYRAEPEKKRTSRRARYRADPEKERTSRRARYRADPEKKRTSRRARYRADPEKERAAKRQRYWQSPERARSAKRVKVTQRYVVST